MKPSSTAEKLRKKLRDSVAANKREAGRGRRIVSFFVLWSLVVLLVYLVTR